MAASSCPIAASISGLTRSVTESTLSRPILRLLGDSRRTRVLPINWYQGSGARKSLVASSLVRSHVGPRPGTSTQPDVRIDFASRISGAPRPLPEPAPRGRRKLPVPAVLRQYAILIVGSG